MTTSHPLTVLIFSVNDVYQTKNFGRLTQFVKDTVAARNPDKHFVTMNGDFLSPSLLSSIDKGKTKIKLMNNVPFDYVGIGNHEFDHSVKNLLHRIKQSSAKWINSNIHSLPGTLPYDVSEIGPNKFKIGWIGMCTEKTVRLCINVNQEVTIESVARETKKHVNFLRKNKNVDYVIALTHQDIALDRNTAAREEIDLILGGHDHVPYIEKHTNVMQKDCWIVKVGKDATNVGVVTMTISPDHKHVETTVECVDITNPSLPTDPTAEQIISEGELIVEHVKERLLTTVPLHGIGVREKRTEFATWLLSKVRDTNRVDVVLVCGFYFKGKQDYLNGFSISDLHRELKWDEVCRMTIPGKVIDQMIHWSHSQGKWGGFLQADDGVQVDKDNHVTHIANKPIVPDYPYKTLLPRDLKNGTDPRTNNRPLQEYIQTLPKKQRPKHESPSLLETIVASLIQEEWETVFGKFS
jgi:2',3'-cyclic-nucleotide 2'-phosphodiesterase (5'-nucleotidase family)